MWRDMEREYLLHLETYFAAVEDPRIERTKRHKLLDIIIIAICGTICGAEGWVDIEEFGKAKEEWLKTILELPNGIPSHDTFGRVFARLDPVRFSTPAALSQEHSLRDGFPGSVLSKSS